MAAFRLPCAVIRSRTRRLAKMSKMYIQISNPHGLDKTARKNCEIVYIDIAERRRSDDQVRVYVCERVCVCCAYVSVLVHVLVHVLPAPCI